MRYQKERKKASHSARNIAKNQSTAHKSPGHNPLPLPSPAAIFRESLAGNTTNEVKMEKMG